MSTDLVTVDLTQLPSTQLGSDEQFSELSRSAGFLGRLQLFTKGDAINEGLIPPGTYGIAEAKDRIIKLGVQIDVLPLARRTKALDMNDQSPITSYDANSDQFKDIAARSQESESKCMYGTSFLLFERSTGRFLEYFFGSKSTRPIAGDVAVFLPLTQTDIDRKKAAGADVSKMEAHGPRPCTMKVRLIKSKRGYSWHVPEIQACSVPFTNLPRMETITYWAGPLMGAGMSVAACRLLLRVTNHVTRASKIVTLLLDSVKIGKPADNRITLCLESVTVFFRRKP